MDKPRTVVILQRDSNDAERISDELHRVEPELVVYIATTLEDYHRHLSRSPALVIADIAPLEEGDSTLVSHVIIPDLNDPLAVFQTYQLEIPFIIVTDPQNETQAAAALRHGATDYLMRDRLARLGPLVERVFTDVQHDGGYREEHDVATALSDIAAILNRTLNFDTVIERILVTVGRVLPHDAANVMLIEDEHVYVIGHRGYAERGLKTWIENLWWPLAKMPNLQSQITTRTPLAIPDARNYDDWFAEPESSWVGSLASAPIVLDREVIGFLNLDKAESGFYDQRHAERLMAFANQASVAIRNAQLYGIVHRHAAELEKRVIERTAELRKSETRYRAIVEDQTEFIVRYLPDWTVTFVNRAFSRYCNETVEALVGRSFLSFVDEDERAAVADLIGALTAFDPARVIEHRFNRPDGDTTWLQWTSRIVLDPRGDFLEYQAVGRDITERRKAEEVLRKSLVREIQLGEMKSRFVSLVSHEFRNPLAVISMNNDILWRYYDRFSAAQREEYLTSTRLHIKAMTDLLDDLLMISQSETGKLEVRPEKLELSEVCRQVIDDVWTTNGAQRQVDFVTSEACVAMTDPKLFRLIVVNLVSNAAKYTHEEGRVEIRLICDHERVVFRVSDNGIGIPEAEQSRLFETFHRASNVDSVPGTGLGLAMVKQCVELLGGTISFQSREHFGTTFTVVLPRKIPLAAPTGPPD